MAQTANKRTYFKRVLPSPPAVAFSSAEGREIFAEALQLGNTVGFFKLIEQFTTQEEPQYCGLAALSMTLNALGIDPRRTWKGAWRWFSETMLDCCKTMEDIKRDGITLSQAACLARCNGADVSVHRYGSFDGLTFRRLLREVCASEDCHMVVSYSRKTFKQSGDGHFSPIGGYNPQRDLVLILDVARFKYSPHWVRVGELMEAMGLLDPAIGRPRGFLLMARRQPRESALFTVDLQPAPVSSPGLEGGELQSDSTSSQAPTAAADAVLQRAPCAAAVPPLPACLPRGDASHIPLPPEPRWAAAHRFVTREAPALVARLLSATEEWSQQPGHGGGEPAAAGEGACGEGDTAAGHEEGKDEDGVEEEGAALVGQPSRPVVVPSLEEVVGRLVNAAPLDSVCALLARRPPLGSVGERRKGPCCGCCGPDAQTAGGVEAAIAAGRGAPAKEGNGPVAAAAAAGTCGAATPAASTFALVAPCNSSRCGDREGSGRGGDRCGSLVSERLWQPLTEATVAAAGAAVAAAAAADGAAAGLRANGGGAAASAPCSSSSQQPTPSPAPALPAAGDAFPAAAAGAASSELARLDAGPGTCGDGLAGGGGLGAAGSSGTLSSRSGDLVASDVAGGSIGSSSSFMGSLGSGHSSCLSSGNSMAMFGSSTNGDFGGSGRISTSGGGVIIGGGGGGGISCCHGEPLEHHCVPPQVQALVADELRFTNCFKLVDYCLRRSRGCPHVAPPDLTAFMQPAGSAPAAKAPTASAPSPGPGSGTGTAAAVAAAASAPPDPSAGRGAGCGCVLGLPELAAEKLTMLLLLVGEGEGVGCPEGQQQQLEKQEGGMTAPGGPADVVPVTAPAARSGELVRQCGRPRCRKCRQRAAAAGDRAAALALLREGWRQLIRMAPLGLFASSPVLADEVSFLRMHLSHAGMSCRS